MAGRATAPCRICSNEHLIVSIPRGAIVGTAAVRSFKFFGVLVQKAGPYLLLELLLPGGTLFALLLYVYRKQSSGTIAAPRNVVARWIAALRSGIIIAQLTDIASVWRGRHRERDGLEALAMMPM